jgi:hypothetical protein
MRFIHREGQSFLFIHYLYRVLFDVLQCVLWVPSLLPAQRKRSHFIKFNRITKSIIFSVFKLNMSRGSPYAKIISVLF